MFRREPKRVAGVAKGMERESPMQSVAIGPRSNGGTGILEKAQRIGSGVLIGLGVTIPQLMISPNAGAQDATVSFSTAEVAPADSVAYAVMTLDNNSDQWLLSKELLNRAGFGEAIDQAINEELTDDDGTPLPLDAFLGGEVAIVVSDVALDNAAEESLGTSDMDAMMAEMGLATPEAGADMPTGEGFAAVLDARAPDTAWAGIRQSAIDGPSEESIYEGVTIISTPPADDSEGMAAARVGSHILIATAPADLFPLIDTANGTSPSITEVPAFATGQGALPTEFMMFTFVNSLANADVDLGPMASMSDAFFPDSFTAATLAADPAGFRVETVVIPGEDAPNTVSAPFASELVKQAPEGAMVFASAGDLGATGMLDAIGAAGLSLALGMGGSGMEGESTPPTSASPEEIIAQQYESAAALLGFNLQTDLFRQFVGEYGGWIESDATGENVSGLFTSHVADVDTVTNAVMQLSFLIQGAAGGDTGLSTRTVGDGQVYVIDLGDEAGSTLEFGVVGDQFVIGSGDAVDRLESAEGSLAENAQYQAVMANLPSEGNGYLYVDLKQALPILEATSEEADDFDFGSMGEITDASETCANYPTQADAQSAYDAGEPDTFDLDQDFDGEVCEDFFSPVDVEIADGEADDSELDLSVIDYSAVTAYGQVSHEENGLQHTSAILFIAE